MKLVNKEYTVIYMYVCVSVPRMLQVRRALWKHHELIYSIFTYYAAFGSDGQGHLAGISLAAYHRLLDDFQIVDTESRSANKYCTPAALDNLDGSAALRAHLGDAFVDSYLKLRRAHWDEYAADLSPWEWRAYLDS